MSDISDSKDVDSCDLANSKSAKHCWNCKKNLEPSDALTCVVCNSPQNWRRYVMVSQTTLALIVALLSVLTVVLPIIGKLFDENRSKLAVDVLRLRDSVLGDTETFLIEAQVSNVGKGTAVIRSFLIQFDKDIGCGATELQRTCGKMVLPKGTCELVYLVKDRPVETPTSRLIEANHIEVAQLHFLLNNGLKFSDIPPIWSKLYADVRNSDRSRECLNIDISSLK